MSEKTLLILEITFIEIDVKSTKVNYRRKCIYTAYQFLILKVCQCPTKTYFSVGSKCKITEILVFKAIMAVAHFCFISLQK